MAMLVPEGKQSFSKSDGTPLVGGKLYTYAAGTSTPKATYADSAATTPNTNPVILDSRGEASVFWTGSYKAVLKDSSDVTIWTVDNINADAELAGSGGASKIGYLPAGTGAVAADVQSKLREINVSVFGFMTPADRTANYLAPGSIDVAYAFQAAMSSGALRVELEQGQVYLVSSSSLQVSVSGQQIIGNGAKIIFSKEQHATTPSYADSLFNVLADDVLIENIKLQYTGAFTVGGADYGGYVSGIQVEESDRFTARNVEAYGFNRAGINVAMGATYCLNPTVTDCYLHHNRVAGVIYGNTAGGTVSNCNLAFNGISTGANVGYGFAGWSTCVPKNTILSSNQASDNYRKGLDFHAGENGTVTGNVCARNRIYGIYLMGVKGSWSIVGNTVTDMSWADEFPTATVYGIRVGDLVGQGLSEIPTSFVIDGNVISAMTKTAGTMVPLGDSMVGCSYGKLTISNNIISVGTVTQLHEGANGVTGTAGNYFDIAFTGNQFNANSCDSSFPPINIRSNKSRQKVFSENSVSIPALTTTQGVVSYDSSAATSQTFVAVGNAIIAPASAWSAIYDPIYVRRTASEKASNNIVNAAPWRDWDGYKFVDGGTGIPASNYWSRGSIVTMTNASAAATPGWVCVTAGAPGTWKAMAVLAA